jgi:hypothetical protein
MAVPSTQIWVALVTLALDLTAWMQLLLALTSTPARHWNPNVCGYELAVLRRNNPKPRFSW